ncbi:TIGR01906 family membrane protein [Pseudolactococcus insecticola]|uniref:Membrane protein n=1 Tax=Pseudolactococcus insecticola TaxID=2709158 RepID=A0A6A0B6H8_9LACT|nr:TIGR01906 family membrane protein [Lactococcus insecticola]GFH40862.1 membrane protein [Lactococcus insecticola]
MTTPLKDNVYFVLTILWSIAAGTTVTIFAAIPMFQGLVSVFKLSEITFLTRRTIVYNFDVLMRYLLNPLSNKLVMPDFISSSAGLKHFLDVKHLFLVAIVGTILLAVPAVMFVRRRLFIQFYQGLKIMVLMPVLVGVTSLFGGFDAIFIAFHELFFRNSDWLFDPVTDPVINILPERFFMLCFIVFGVLYLIFWGGLLIFTRRSLTHAKN